MLSPAEISGGQVLICFGTNEHPGFRWIHYASHSLCELPKGDDELSIGALNHECGLSLWWVKWPL